MKFLSALLLALLFSSAASAQSLIDQQINLVRQAAQTDRQAIILGNVHFTSEESDLFWPAWKQYRAKEAANGDRLLALIKNYAANYTQMTDQVANELLTDHFSIAMQDVAIKQGFAKQIGMFLPALKVMRVIQIENKLDAAIDLQLAAEIPLVD